MLDQNRTLLQPGQGIVRDAGPATNHSEYPKHMVHPGYRPGKAAKEVKLNDEAGNPGWKVAYVGGEAIRFPPVLVMDEKQEEFHKSQGYVSVGKSDPAAFARAVAAAAPPVETHVPEEYPKWIVALGRSVNNAEEEAEALRVIAETQTITADSPRKVPEPFPPPQPSREPSDNPRLDRIEDQIDQINANERSLGIQIAGLADGMSKLSDLLRQFVSGDQPAPERGERPPKLSLVPPGQDAESIEE